MSAAGDMYMRAIEAAFAGNFNFVSDTLKLGLLTPNYNPSLIVDQRWTDISLNEITPGGSYVAGGKALTAVNSTTYASAFWGVRRVNSSTYNFGDIIGLATDNGFLYRAVVGGVTASAVPSGLTTLTTVGQTVVDGGVTWACVGYAVFTLFTGGGNVDWPSVTGSVAYAVLYDSISGYLIALQTFDSTKILSASEFIVLLPGFTIPIS